MRILLAHWGDKKRHIFEPIAFGLKSLGHECAWIARDDMAERPRLLDEIRSNRIDLLLTWQRFYPMQSEIGDAIRQAGPRTLYMDYGFVRHYESVVFDSLGENAASALRQSWSQVAAIGMPNVDLGAIAAEHAPRAILDEGELPEWFERVEYPFVFLPLQRAHDSVIRFDSTVHDFGKLVRRVLLLARGRFFVVTKVHPLDADQNLGVPEYTARSHLIMRSGFGPANEAMNRCLLRDAALVVGINSNMLFRAMLYDRPVIATGSGWFSGSGALIEVAGVDGLRSLVVPPPDYAARRRYMSACLARQLLITELSEPEALERVFRAAGVEMTAGAVRV